MLEDRADMMWLRGWLCVLGACILSMVAVHADTRVALVIGNGAYEHVVHLSNTPRDADGVAKALQGVGFAVTSNHDMSKAGMEAALHAFSKIASSADIAVVYYAGHGIEAAGVNYLIPVDASPHSDSDLKFEAIPLDLVQDAVEGARTLKLVMLDACRDNPFAAQMSGDNRSAGTRGLARFEPKGNTLVAYAAKAGKTAADGVGDHSPFAAAFVREVATPGLDIQVMFGRIRDDVLAATSRQQEPVTYGSIGGEQLFFVQPVGSAADETLAALSLDRALWKSVCNSENVDLLTSYLDRFPGGEHAQDAKAKIATLKRTPATQTKNSDADLDERLRKSWLGDGEGKK